jgi:predicted permease
MNNIQLAARTLRRSPAFTVTTMLSLALGLAFTSTAMAVANAYLFQPLPYPEPGRLYHVMYAPPGPWEPAGMSAIDWTSVGDVVEHAITASSATVILNEAGVAGSVQARRASPGFVQALVGAPAFGRVLTAEDWSPAADRVAMIGHGLWRGRLGADPAVLGRTLRFETDDPRRPTESFRVVGVLRPDFYFGRTSRDTIDLLVPIDTPVQTYMVRLRPGVPLALAERRLTDAARTAATSAIPADWTGVHLFSVRERYLGSVRPVLIGVLSAVGVVLLVACANVGVLMALRAARRSREIAIRAALGSARRHLVAMLFAETALLCAAALALAVGLSVLALRVLTTMIEQQLGRPAPAGPSSIGIDGTVLLIGGGIAVAMALSLSFLPLVTVRPTALAHALRRESRAASDGRLLGRLRPALIALEVAGSVVLVATGSLMMRSVLDMMRTDLGFRAEGLSRVQVVLRQRPDADGAAFRRLHEQFVERASAFTNAPAVFTTWPPFIETPTVRVEAREAAGLTVGAGSLGVSRAYFATLSVPLRQGRDFTDEEVTAAGPVAIVSETLAMRLWPGGQAIGREVRVIEPATTGVRTGPWRTVIGVAADVRQSYGDTDPHDIYLPVFPDGRYASFYLRGGPGGGALAAGLRAAAAAIDRDAIVNEPVTVSSRDEMLARTAFLSWTLTAFAAMAAFLAMLGIHGVTAYGVEQRKREVAIRRAVGGTNRAIRNLFLREGGLVLAIGTAVGLVGSLAVARTLQHQMYGVRAFDPMLLAATSVVIVGAGLLATWWPARRAVTDDALTALNGD